MEGRNADCGIRIAEFEFLVLPLSGGVQWLDRRFKFSGRGFSLRVTYSAIRIPHFSYHIRNTPNFVSGIGAFNEAEIPRPRTSRVSRGSITPSSHKRALA